MQGSEPIGTQIRESEHSGTLGTPGYSWPSGRQNSVRSRSPLNRPYLSRHSDGATAALALEVVGCPLSKLVAFQCRSS